MGLVSVCGRIPHYPQPCAFVRYTQFTPTYVRFRRPSLEVIGKELRHFESPDYFESYIRLRRFWLRKMGSIDCDIISDSIPVTMNYHKKFSWGDNIYGQPESPQDS